MSTVEEIMNAAKALPPSEQAELRRRLEELGDTQENGALRTEDESRQHRKELQVQIHRALYEAGLVSELNPPRKRRRERAPLIAIKGQPLSETIIEDRR